MREHLMLSHSQWMVGICQLSFGRWISIMRHHLKLSHHSQWLVKNGEPSFRLIPVKVSSIRCECTFETFDVSLLTTAFYFLLAFVYNICKDHFMCFYHLLNNVIHNFHSSNCLFPGYNFHIAFIPPKKVFLFLRY